MDSEVFLAGKALGVREAIRRIKDDPSPDRCSSEKLDALAGELVDSYEERSRRIVNLLKGINE